MNGGLAMEVIKTRVNADLLSPIINIPVTLKGKEVDVVIRESKESIVDDLFGVAEGLDMSLDDIREERLNAE